MKIIKISILFIALFMFFSNNAFSQTAKQSSEVVITKSIAVKVKGVGCATDIKMISENVEKLDGVFSCKTTKKGATTTFEVKMSPTKVTEKQIYAAIEDTEGCKDPKDRPYKVKL